MGELDVEGFRPIEHISTPDYRSTCYVLFGKNEIRPFTLEDHHAAIDNIKLIELVPKNIQNHFVTAKNLCLYSWFVYRFGPVAEHHSFVSFEYALRERLGIEGVGFKKLLQIAIEQGLLQNNKFSMWRWRREQIRQQNEQNKEIAEMVGFEFKPLSDEVDYLSNLLEAFPALRNYYSHGTSMLHPAKLDILLTCAEGINQLFEESKRISP